MVDVAVAMRRPVRTTQTAHETEETPHFQYVDNVVDVPAGLRHQPSRHHRKRWWFLKVSILIGAVDVLVVTLQQKAMFQVHRMAEIPQVPDRMVEVPCRVAETGFHHGGATDSGQ